jgi:hypothetical protein
MSSALTAAPEQHTETTPSSPAPSELVSFLAPAFASDQDKTVSNVLEHARLVACRARETAAHGRKPSSGETSPPRTLPVIPADTLLPLLFDEFTDRDARRGIKRARLQAEYKAINSEWRSHCERMEKIQAHQLKKRQAFVPPHAPTIDPNSGLPYLPNNPGTPGPPFLSRTNRRNASNAAYGDAVRSEAEFLEILASLENADLKDPNMRAMRTTAVVPDMAVDPSERSCLLDYDDSNRLVRDPEEFFGIHNPKPDVWTQDEVDVFCKRFSQFPKQFGKIAAALPDKTTSQCVLFYYRSKKEIDFRALSDRKGKSRRLKRGTKAASSSLLSNIQAVEEAESPPPTPNTGGAPQRPDRPPSVEPSTAGSITKSLKLPHKGRRYARFASPAQPDSAGSSEAPPSEGLLAAAEALGALAGAVFSNDSNPATPIAEESADAAIDRRRRSRQKDDVNGNVADLLAPPGSRRKSGSSYWTVAERNDFVRLLRIYGRNYAKIAEGLETQTKTPVQCKNVSSLLSSFRPFLQPILRRCYLQFFQNNNKKLGLAEIAAEAEFQKALKNEQVEPPQKVRLSTAPLYVKL